MAGAQVFSGTETTYTWSSIPKPTSNNYLVGHLPAKGASIKDRKTDLLLVSICFEVQSGSRDDFVGLGPDRRTSSVVLVHLG